MGTVSVSAGSAVMWRAVILALCVAALAAAETAPEDRAALSAQCRAMCLDEVSGVKESEVMGWRSLRGDGSLG